MLPPGARAWGLAVLVVVATAALAGAAVTVRSDSTLTVGVRDAPVVFEEGPGATKSRHVTGFALSPNLTSFSGTAKPKAGASMVVKDLAYVKSNDDQARAVTFRANQVSSGAVTTFTWIIRDGTSVVGVFDYKATSPSATFTLPAGARYSLDLRVDLADGAGKNDASASFGLRTEVA